MISLLIILVCIALPLIFIVYYVSPLQTIFSLSSGKNISGRIHDCLTGEAIADAEVSMSGVGWGFRNNRLVWDKVYSESVSSDTLGNYSIDYTIGSELQVIIDGYLQAYYYSEPGNNVDIGLVSNKNVLDKNERTYQCNLESKCYQEVVKDGVIVGWDACANPNYQP